MSVVSGHSHNLRVECSKSKSIPEWIVVTFYLCYKVYVYTSKICTLVTTIT
jgi:hypothetical protein